MNPAKPDRDEADRSLIWLALLATPIAMGQLQMLWRVLRYTASAGKVLLGALVG